MNQYVRWGIIIAATGSAGYFIYTQVKKHNVASGAGGQQQNNTGNNSTPPPSINNIPVCNYPLKNGSKNDCVKLLQLALISAFTAGVLPKYGADGSWGSETDGAVMAAIGKKQIDSQTELQQTLAYLASFTVMSGMGFSMAI